MTMVAKKLVPYQPWYKIVFSVPELFLAAVITPLSIIFFQTITKPMVIGTFVFFYCVGCWLKAVVNYKIKHDTFLACIGYAGLAAIDFMVVKFTYPPFTSPILGVIATLLMVWLLTRQRENKFEVIEPKKF
jgi:hypothetical protein